MVAKPKQRRYLEEAVCNGFSYQVGCSAYVVLDAEAGAAASELEVCEICEMTKKKRGRKEVPMLECDKCLRGYHLDCLDPPLDAVPEVRGPVPYLYCLALKIQLINITFHITYCIFKAYRIHCMCQLHDWHLFKL